MRCICTYTRDSILTKFKLNDDVDGNDDNDDDDDDDNDNDNDDDDDDDDYDKDDDDDYDEDDDDCVVSRLIVFVILASICILISGTGV